MIEIIQKESCTGCAACANLCPTDSITMVRDTEGFLYPSVDTERCIRCSLCVKQCPVQNNPFMQTEQLPNAYAVINNDRQQRLSASSGGVFALLADAILQKAGTVYGAAFDNEFTLQHCGISAPEKVSALYGSKYVQSDIGLCFRQIKQQLLAGQWVLFVGTPCQTAGLLNFLGNRCWDTLLTADFICHGVPSPSVWKKYVCEMESQAGSSLSSVNFRCKRDGWSDLFFHACFKNQTELYQAAHRNAYMNGFLKNLTLRPSCYQCAFKAANHRCDLTLADFWGIRHVLPSFYDNKGCSLILTHTDKAEAFLKQIQDKAKIQSVDTSQAIAHNTALTRSSPLPADRQVFFHLYAQQQPVTASLHTLCKEPFKTKCIRFIKRIARKIRGS